MTLERDDNETSINLSSGNDKCVICLEKCRKPTFLQCMHRFCEEPCLQNFLYSSPSNTFKCPICRTEYFVETFECVGGATGGRLSSESEPFLTQPTEMTRSITGSRSSYRGAVTRTVETNLDRSYLMGITLDRDDNETRFHSSSSYGNDKCVICLESCRNPIFLLCMHRFCEEPCLQNLLQSSPSDTFKCPICRTEYFVETFECVRGETGDRLSSESNLFLTQPTEMIGSITGNRSSYRGIVSRTVEPNVDRSYLMGNTLERDDNETRFHSSSSHGNDKCVICLESCRNPTFLLCMHRFCEEPCLQNLLQSSPSDTFKCPICRTEYFVQTFECVKGATGDRLSSESNPFLTQPTEMTGSVMGSRFSYRGAVSRTVEPNLDRSYLMENRATRETRATGNRTSSQPRPSLAQPTDRTRFLTSSRSSYLGAVSRTVEPNLDRSYLMEYRATRETRATGNRNSSEPRPSLAQPTERTGFLTSSRSSFRDAVCCTEESISDNSCGSRLSCLGFIVGVVHFVFVSIARFIAGNIIQNKVAAFHVWVGSANFGVALTMALTICCKGCCGDRITKCLISLLFGFCIVISYSIIYLWGIECNRNDDCGVSLLLSKCYSIVDGIMIAYLIVFGCCMASRNN